ncbi:hypothetical protein Barb6_03762 [Bacteroidales bacterium Barb6]|nr:hypothetical protein Barb6_03762 [Bacteroidales bacterium Barb6]
MVTIQTAKTSGFAAGAFAGISELIVSAGNWTVDDLGKITPGVAARYTVPSPYPTGEWRYFYSSRSRRHCL